MKCLAIRRDDRFSPNAVENDRTILKRSCELLGNKLQLAEDIQMVDEQAFVSNPVDAEIFLSMARLTTTLRTLLDEKNKGHRVLNDPQGVLNCRRSTLDRLMRENHVAMPPLTGDHGYWLKRGDEAAQSKADVVFCKDEKALAKAKGDFKKRGIEDMVTSAHMPGDLVKFYGVGQGFFEFFYPSDDGISKFGDEKRNGVAHHYTFCHEDLHLEAVRVSQLTGIGVFGGDAIVDADGHFFIIDFNDWPSFSRCREAAAEAIANYVVDTFKGTIIGI